MLDSATTRIFVFLALMLSFWLGSSYYYTEFVRDLPSPYWWLGLWGSLILVGLFSIVDLFIRHRGWLRKREGIFMTASLLVGIALYVPTLATLLWMIVWASEQFAP